ncbi:MAG: trypsin-like serine protease [Tepidisphaeraceae bacterium]
MLNRHVRQGTVSPRPSRIAPVRTLACGLLVSWATAATANAGTIRHDRVDADYRAYGNQPQFASVGSYSTGSLFGSFTLIAPQWALTAAHVVDTDGDGLVSDETIANDTLRIGSQSRTAAEVIVPTGINGNRGWNGDINAGFDIALVRLTTPFTGITPASIYTSFQELGKTVTQVGFGQSGTGKTGSTGASGTKRAGDNVVDQLKLFSNGATALIWDFDEPSPRTSPNFSGSSSPLDMEYLIGSGDSGGGSFIFENDAWRLAGVHSGTYDFYNYPGAADNGSTYGDGALITRVAAYQQFIASNIPELAALVPEPGGLALLGFAGVLAMRRRTRRAPAGSSTQSFTPPVASHRWPATDHIVPLGEEHRIMQRNHSTNALYTFAFTAGVMAFGAAAAQAAPVAYQTAVTANSPYAYYRLSDTSSPAVATVGANGTYTGTPTFSQAGTGLASDDAVSFDGVSTGNDALAANINTFGSQMAQSSYEFVFKVNAGFSSTTIQSLFGVFSKAANLPDVNIDLNSRGNDALGALANTTRLFVRGNNADANGGASIAAHFTNASLYDGNYHHLVFTYDDAQTGVAAFQAYVDGVAQTMTFTQVNGSVEPAGFSDLDADGVFAGRNVRQNPLTTVDREANVTIDEAVLYGNDVLSLSEVQAHATAAGFVVVPEPGSLALAGIAGLGLLARRRKQA